MHRRAQTLIDELHLVPHPEGGYFREIHRSSTRVAPADGRPPRDAVTSIYFLLTDEGPSRWHRVQSDELWHFYEGDAVDLFTAAPSIAAVSSVRLGLLGEAGVPCHVVPAGSWQAARTRGAYSLVGCTVAPGFEYADFSFLRDDNRDVARLRALDEAWLAYI